MNLTLNTIVPNRYKSNSQIARLVTENWLATYGYCTFCGNNRLNQFENNRPAADFFCTNCHEEFELKSKRGKATNTIPDGAYSTMIERIHANNNPNLLFLTYDINWRVNDLLLIPKYFFTSDIIIKRNPLSANARRAGWTGCNIDISAVSELGKIHLIKDSVLIDKADVTQKLHTTIFLKDHRVESRGWLLDILQCIEITRKRTFTLKDIYAFESLLKSKHPNNFHIKDKIRQQLQILRDKNIIHFLGKGHYSVSLV